MGKENKVYHLGPMSPDLSSAAQSLLQLTHSQRSTPTPPQPSLYGHCPSLQKMYTAWALQNVDFAILTKHDNLYEDPPCDINR